MATKLEGDKTVTREVHVYGIEKPLVLTFSATGIKMRVRGARKHLTVTWYEVVRSARLPLDAPAKFAQDAFKFLQSQDRPQPRR